MALANYSAWQSRKFRIEKLPYFFLIIILLAGSFPLVGKEPKPFFNPDIGQDYDKFIALTVFECSMGYVWIGTKTGLLQYDGYSVTRYTAKPGDESGLHNTRKAECFCKKKNLTGKKLFTSETSSVRFFLKVSSLLVFRDNLI